MRCLNASDFFLFIAASGKSNHMNTKGLYALLGFSLLIIGFLSLVLMLVGVQLSFLTWIDSGGRLWGFLGRLLLIIGGIIIIMLTQTNWRSEEEA